jgi:hypothetical protein
MKKRDKLPKLQSIYLSIETNEGTTDCNWSSGKKLKNYFLWNPIQLSGLNDV